LPVRYIFEKIQGLSAARNRALSEMAHDVIIFFDDDVTIQPYTVDEYRDAFTQFKGHQLFGGKIDVDWLGDIPNWYKSDQLPLINGLLVNYDLGSQSKEYQSSDLKPYGANFALRRPLIDRVGKFDTALGVNGKGIARGEESDYFERAFLLNFKGIYIPKAMVGHRYDSKRVSFSYLYRYGIEKGKCLPISSLECRLENAKNLVVFLLKGAFQLLKGRKDHFYQCVINMGIQHALLFADRGAS